MGRQLTGKMHTGQRRETRPNGDVYVYERVTAYDPKTKKTRTVIRCHTTFRHPFNFSWSGKTCDIRRSSKTTS